MAAQLHSTRNLPAFPLVWMAATFARMLKSAILLQTPFRGGGGSTGRWYGVKIRWNREKLCRVPSVMNSLSGVLPFPVSSEETRTKARVDHRNSEEAVL